MISISVIIPVYNEESSILLLLEKLNKIKEKIQFEIIVVNDGSKDNTKKILDDNSNLYQHVKHLENNFGKGKAVIEGLSIASNEYIFFQDADLEYDPGDLLRFIQVVEFYKSDMVMGSRFIGDQRTILNFWHMVGNKFITILFNFLNNTTYTDIYCCYCFFKKKNLPIENLKSNGWGQHAEILTYLSNNSKKKFEISVSYDGRLKEEGKKIRYYNILEVLYWIISTKLKIFLKID